MHKIIRKIVSVSALITLLGSNYVFNGSVFALDGLGGLLIPNSIAPINDNLELTIPVQNAILEPVKEIQPTLEYLKGEITICHVDPDNIWDPIEKQVNRFDWVEHKNHDMDYEGNCLKPNMTVEKTNSGVILNEDNTYTIVYNVTVRNSGGPGVYNLEDELEPLPTGATATVLGVIQNEDDDSLELPVVKSDFNALDKGLIIENELIKKGGVDKFYYKINYSVDPTTLPSELKCSGENNTDENIVTIENYVKVVFDDFMIENTGRFTKLNTYKYDISGTCSQVSIPELPKKFGTVDGWKFNDIDGSGYWNDGTLTGTIAEPGLNGFEIVLSSSGTSAKTYTGVTYTDSFWGTGYFSFTGVLVGTYKLCEVNQAGWEQTYPDETIYDVIDGCHNIEVTEDNNVRRYFGNHYLGLPDTGTGTTDSSTGTTDSSTGTILNGTGTIVNDNKGSESFQSDIKKIVGGSGGGTRQIRKLISYDVKNTTESAGLTGSPEQNITKIYNDYLEKLNRLTDIERINDTKLAQEKKLLDYYLNGTLVTTKLKLQINKVITKLNKIEIQKRQELIINLFEKLDNAEVKFSENSNLLNLISYLKLKLTVSYFKN